MLLLILFSRPYLLLKSLWKLVLCMVWTKGHMIFAILSQGHPQMLYTPMGQLVVAPIPTWDPWEWFLSRKRVGIWAGAPAEMESAGVGRPSPAPRTVQFGGSPYNLWRRRIRFWIFRWYILLSWGIMMKLEWMECEDYMKRKKNILLLSLFLIFSAFFFFFKKKTTCDYFLIFSFSYWYVFKFIKQSNVT